jgi:non-homologous end joining protein Ku
MSEMTAFTGLPMAEAKEPSRSSGSFTLSWGLVSIPLSVYNGTESTYVARKEFVDGNPEHQAGRAIVDKATGEMVDRSRVIKMAQATSGAWVVLDDDEIKACTLEKGVAEIVAFVPREQAELYVAEDRSQLRPRKEKGKLPIAAERAYSLLLTAMNLKSVYALIKFSVRGPARYGLLTTSGDLIYVKSADQVRKQLDMAWKEHDETELQLAEQLIEAVGISTPVVYDDTARKVQEMVDAKAGGAAPIAPTSEVRSDAPDIMASLLASIEEAKKEKVDK